jgi:hypothetical protein
MDQPSKWEDYIHLVKFGYNNEYQASLKKSLFEALYDMKCNTPVSWDNPTDKSIIGRDLLKEMEEKMTRIRPNLKVMQIRIEFFMDFKVGKHVFLKVKAKISSISSIIYA